MNWLYNVFNSNNRTKILFVVGTVLAGLQANAGFVAFEGSHKTVASVFALVVFVYAAFNHPTGSNGPTMKGI